MSLIKHRPKEVLKPYAVRIPESLIRRLERYSQFTNVPQAEIVGTALNYALDSDKEFVAACLQPVISEAFDKLQVVTAGAPETSRSHGVVIPEGSPKSSESDSAPKAIRA